MGDENIYRWSVRKHIYIPSTDSYSVVNEDVVSASDHDRIVAELQTKLDVEQFAHEYDVNQLNERVETLTKKLSNSLSEVVEVKKGNYEFSEQLAKQRYTIAELRAELVREQVITDDLTDRLVESHERNRDIEYSCQELRAEVFAANHKLDKYRAASKMLEITIARQAREAKVSKAVIEKLKRCLLGFVEYFRAIKNGEVGPPRERLRSFEMVLLDSSNSLLKELAAIEKEGAKDE